MWNGIHQDIHALILQSWIANLPCKEISLI